MNSNVNLARRMISTGPKNRVISTIPQKKITFYYDVVCPYSWYAFEVLHRYKQKWWLNINYKPVFLGGIYRSSNNASPGLVPNKAKHMAVDLARCAKYFDVPLRDCNYEDMLHKGSIEPMRFLTALKMHFPEYLEEMSRQFWMRRFHEGKEFNSVKAIEAVADMRNTLPYLETEHILKMAEEQEAKDALRRTTQEAIDKGAFGVPVILIHGDDGSEEFYFGSDRFPMIAEELGKEWLGPRLKYFVKP